MRHGGHRPLSPRPLSHLSTLLRLSINTTARSLPTSLQETTEAWRAAEAETVRAEHAAKRAEQVACEADRLAAEAAAAKGMT